MCNTAIDEKPILTTSFKTTQRGRAFSRSTFTPPGGIMAKFSDDVFKHGAQDGCYQKWSLVLQKKNSNRGVNYQTLSNKRTKMRVLMMQTATLHSGNMEENHSQSTRGIVHSNNWAAGWSCWTGTFTYISSATSGHYSRF